MTNTKGFLNRNQLKYLVIAAMLIDHIAWAFVPTASLLGQVMHVIGRLTGPTMAYMLAEGYHYTRNVKKYAMRLGIFAVISWLPFSYFESGGIRPAFGVIYTLFLSLLAIWFWDKAKCSLSVKWLDIFGLCLLSVFGDWAIFDVLYALTFFRYRESPREKWLSFGGITLVCCMSVLTSEPMWSGLFQLGIFLVIPLIQYCYNGEGGSKKPFHKWFFYVFYPLHLLVLGVLRWCLRKCSDSSKRKKHRSRYLRCHIFWRSQTASAITIPRCMTAWNAAEMIGQRMRRSLRSDLPNVA